MAAMTLLAPACGLGYDQTTTMLNPT